MMMDVIHILQCNLYFGAGGGGGGGGGGSTACGITYTVHFCYGNSLIFFVHLYVTKQHLIMHHII